MGGLNVYQDSIHLNLTNPAAYTELKLVNYSVGTLISINILKLKIQMKKFKQLSIII